MHGAVVASGLEWAGAVLAIVLNAPQAWTSCRRRRVGGLSPAARWLAVLQAATWVAYGLTGGGPVQVLTNAVCGVLHLSVLVAVLLLAPSARAPRLLVPQALASAAWLALVVLSARTGAVPVGALAALCGVAALVPQLVLLSRARGRDVSGVSPATTWLTLACAACYTGYGLLLAGWAVWVPSALGLLAASATLALLRAPAAPPAEDLAVLPSVPVVDLTALVPVQRVPVAAAVA